MRVKVIFLLLDFVLKLVETYLKTIEKTSDKDVDGFPFDSEYNTLSALYVEISQLLECYNSDYTLPEISISNYKENEE